MIITRPIVLFALSVGLFACPEGRALGETCVTDSECASSLCFGSCLDPNSDLDGDGIPNEVEVSRLQSNPRSVDSDGDGIGDELEWGGDPKAGLDSDNDGRWDINESSVDDSDGDCVSDQADPVDDTVEALIEQVCATAGVCTKTLLKLACSGTTLSCDYSGVSAYNLLDTCNGLDDDCDGTVDNLGAATGCDDGNRCTDDRCDGINGCVTEANEGPCDDGDVCTLGDACADGACATTTSLDCNDDNICTDDSCDSALGCQNLANTLACDDGEPCTIGVCSDRVCTSGSPTDCDDNNVCTDDSCDPVIGCQNVANTASCDDGNLCTVGDACNNGTCENEGIALCADSNPCTGNPVCDPATGACLQFPVDGNCDDGSVCTTGDFCSNGGCTGDPIDCDDGNPCTVDSCDFAAGCQSTPDVGASCDDGNACTVAECGVPQKSASTCEALGWLNAESFGDPTVCGESDVPTCVPTIDFAGAAATCSAIGARLCTLREVVNDETSGTGCGLNAAVVWTASPCEDGVSAWVRLGSSGLGNTTECRSLQDVAGVRCCADTEAANVVATCEAVAPVCNGGDCGVLTCDPAVGCSVQTVDEATCDDGEVCSIDTCSAFVGCLNATDACDLDLDGVLGADDVDDADPNACRDVDVDNCDDCSVTGADQSGGDITNDGADLDGDDLCDLGDPDIDGDGIPNTDDLCPRVFGANQADGDGDGAGDICDNCLTVENPDQVDVDGDGIGLACEAPLPTAAGSGPQTTLNYGHCAPGHVAAGFTAIVGAYHDDLDFACREVLGGGQVASTGTDIGYAGSTTSTGSPISYDCPPDEVVVGFSILTSTSTSPYFYSVSAHCSSVMAVQTGADNTAAPIAGTSSASVPGGPLNVQVFCPTGQVMTGFVGYGNNFNWIVSLSLFCDTP